VRDSPPEYYAYLIRLWRTGPDGPWRVSLEDAKTGERVGFEDLAAACAYLRAKTRGGAGKRGTWRTSKQTRSGPHGDSSDASCGVTESS
jgi:hypothetical protein